MPLPSVDEADWVRPGDSAWKTNAASATVERDPKYGAQMLHLVWADDAGSLVAEVTSRSALRDRAVDLTRPGTVPALSGDERRLYLEPTALIHARSPTRASARAQSSSG